MDTLFYWLSKLLWLLIAPDSQLLILLTIACIALGLGYAKTAQGILIVVVVGLWLIILLPVTNLLLKPLETRFPTNPELPPNLDGIIVLGGAENVETSKFWQQVEIKAYAERALAFMHLAKRYPNARLVFAGGPGNHYAEDYQESDVAKLLFQQQGMDLNRIQFVDNCRNTYENAKFGKAEVKPETGEQWLLITSASHMPRAVGVFCKAGWPVIPYPVDHWTTPNHGINTDIAFAGKLEKFTYALREWAGLTAYYLSGKTPSLFPGPCQKHTKPQRD